MNSDNNDRNLIFSAIHPKMSNANNNASNADHADHADQADNTNNVNGGQEFGGCLRGEWVKKL